MNLTIKGDEILRIHVEDKISKKKKSKVKKAASGILIGILFEDLFNGVVFKRSNVKMGESGKLELVEGRR